MSSCLKHPPFRLAASEDREFCQDRAKRDMVNPRSAANRKPSTGGRGGESSPAVGDADSIARRPVAGEKRGGSGARSSAATGRATLNAATVSREIPLSWGQDVLVDGVVFEPIHRRPRLRKRRNRTLLEVPSSRSPPRCWVLDVTRLASVPHPAKRCARSL